MAGFKTHITTSTVLGIGYGAAAYGFYHVPIPTCVLAGGLCSVAGMFPDLDSGPGRPLRESLAFAAAVVPMMLLHRIQHLGFAPETNIMIGGAIYLAIRFGVGWLLRHYTVHRGMFHSLPAAAIAAELTFLICGHEQEGLWLRFFNAGAVVLGFMSHLVLDEIWSIEFKTGIPRFKKSFGTAIKLWSDSLWGNLSAYGKLAILTWFVIQDPIWKTQSPESTPATQNQMISVRPTKPLF
jgi:hypothetical protein